MKLLKSSFLVICFVTSWAYAQAALTLTIEKPVIIFYQGDIPGAGYMTIRQTGAHSDQLLAVHLAPQHGSQGRIELHDHVSKSIDGHEVKQMVTLAAVDMEPGSEVQFASGGKHLMLYDFSQSLKESKTITLILVFKKAGEVSVDFDVQSPSAFAEKNKKNCGCHNQ